MLRELRLRDSYPDLRCLFTTTDRQLVDSSRQPVLETHCLHHLHQKVEDSEITRDKFIQETLKFVAPSVKSKLDNRNIKASLETGGEGENFYCDFKPGYWTKKDQLLKSLQRIVDGLNEKVNGSEARLGLFWLENKPGAVALRFNATDDVTRIKKFYNLIRLMTRNSPLDAHNLDDLVKALILEDFSQDIKQRFSDVAVCYRPREKKLKIYTLEGSNFANESKRLVDDYNTSLNVEKRLGILRMNLSFDSEDQWLVYDVDFTPTAQNQTYKQHCERVMANIANFFDFADRSGIVLDQELLEKSIGSALSTDPMASNR